MNLFNGLSGTVRFWRDGYLALIRYNRFQAHYAIDLNLAEDFAAGCCAIADDRELGAVLGSGEGRVSPA